MKPYYEDARSGITIYHGDCMEVLPTLPPVDLLLTDPPYGVDFAEWDADAPKEWLAIVRELSPVIFVTTGIQNAFDWPKPDWIASYSYPVGFKRSKGGGFNNWEPVLIYGKNPLPLDAKQFPPIASEKITGHPCAKPLPPMCWLISKGTKARERVLDPFMGSGTTGVACVRLGREFIGIELREKYCEIAASRIDKELSQGKLFEAAPEPSPEPQHATLFAA